MCGIVGYFGTTGNSLTRPLTGMSAIVYRAPDSSGIGFFRDDTESIRLIKSLGSVTGLIETLLKEDAYPNRAGRLMELWGLDGSPTSLMDRQRRLLTWEGFSIEMIDALHKGEMNYPTVEQLLGSNTASSIRIAPGQPGRAAPLPVFIIRSPGDLRHVIEHLITHHDLSFLAIQTLIRQALCATLDKWREEDRIERDPREMLGAFDGLFSQALREECRFDPDRIECSRFSTSPSIEKAVWRALIETHIKIPSDFDNDGVRGLFRLLDAALLSRLPHRAALNGELQKLLETFWPQAGREKQKGLGWRTLYRAERGVNVYGWAAASALAHLQQNEVLPALKDASEAENMDLGQTDALSLRYISSPIIAHGRWALQSPATAGNAHPFVDATGRRCIVLNGQFDSKVEKEAAEFLRGSAGCTFRSQNSAEYFALFWGYYSELFQEEKRRFEATRLQVDGNLERYMAGSQAIDYRIYYQIRNKSPIELDEMAFIQAAKIMSGDGGQLAVAGMSLLSPQRLYVAAHNRPVFVVQRMDTNDFMVVSDVNAAMGLFPQRLIQETSIALARLHRDWLETSEKLEKSKADRETFVGYENAFSAKQASILEPFEVLVYPLEEEETFACIETRIENHEVVRKVRFADFDGNRLHEAKSLHTSLNPLQSRKNLFKSFYESYLIEVPERLEDHLRAYARDEDRAPRLELKDTVLHRRFGHGFVRLKRLLLVGMGSAYNTGLMAREFLQSLLPQLEVLVLRPVEVEHIPDVIVPEKDLVVLLSWSATTADMVDFAKALQVHRTVMIGVTGKRFADMALIAGESAGVVTVLSGEEVTVGAVKSTFCMLFSVALLGLWLMSRLGGGGEAAHALEKLRRLPGLLRRVIEDESLAEFSKELASRSRESRVCLVFDALESTAAGREIALKLQENSWSAFGKCIDYGEPIPPACGKASPPYLVLVNATHEGRLNEALNVMKRLHLEKIPFAAVTYAGPHEQDVYYYTDNRYVTLPKVEDGLQPFVDMMFHYGFAYQFGVAHGRTAEEAPRNRTKSVTAGRSRSGKPSSRGEALALLGENASQLSAETNALLQPLSRETLWERSATCQREKSYYRQMRRLTGKMNREDMAKRLWTLSGDDLGKMATAIFEDLPEEGEIVFVPLDNSARAAAENVVVLLGRFLEYYLRVASRRESLDHFKEDALLIFVAAGAPEQGVLSGILKRVHVPCLWAGPKIPAKEARGFKNSLGYFPFSAEPEKIDNEWIYSGLTALILAAWKERDPEKARGLALLLRLSPYVVQAVLNDDSLHRRLQEAMYANRDYLSAFFIGPPGGTGRGWVNRFDQLPCFSLEALLYGESAHGPLVTVDHRVDKKFIPLENRSEMRSLYGEQRISEWEHRYLADAGIDDFLQHQKNEGADGTIGPFFADGRWYLPLLKPDYDATEDNFIIIDAGCERDLDKALDEVATYGARYARMMVITQRAFLQSKAAAAFQNQPVSHLVLLPSLGEATKALPIPELLLPLAMNLVCMRLAAAASQVRNVSFEPASQRSLFRTHFGALGDVMTRHGIVLGDLNHRLIDSIRALTPVISAVEGIGRYQVKEIRNKEALLSLAGRDRLHRPEKTTASFAAQKTQQTPFYLVRPNSRSFSGRVLELAYPTFQEMDGKRWHEVYGDTWGVLSSRSPDVREISEQESLLMIPLVDRSWEDGRLYHFCLRFAQWDPQAPMPEQVRITARALGSKSAGQSAMSTRYRKIVGHFNADTAARDHSWDDRLLVVVRRSLLLGGSAREMAKILVRRVEKLSAMLRRKHPNAPSEALIMILEKAWRRLQGTETFNDAKRWGVLQEIAGALLDNTEDRRQS